MDKKTVLVTGSGRGIGKRIIEDFAKENYNVIINYNSSKTEAENLANSLTKQGVNCLAIKCDITKDDEVENLINKSIEKFGKIDILVNNSAITSDSLFHEKTSESFLKVYNTNVVGAFLVSQKVGQLMYKNKYGKIINISSTNGINSYFPMCAEYDASKSALISLTHNLALQFAPYVNVNAIAPGFIATESEIADMDEEYIKSEEEKILVRRAGTEEDVSNLVIFLSSDKASFINNTVIRIDGGQYGSI